MKIKENYIERNFTKAVLLISNDVRVIILPYALDKHIAFISFNNETFKALKMSGLRESNSKSKISLTDPDTKKQYVLFYNKTTGLLTDDFDFNFLDVKEITTELEEEYICYKNPIIIESIYEDFENNYYIIKRPEHDWNYTDFSIVKYSKGEIIELKCNNVERYRDGGTTYYETVEGTLYSPTPFDKTKYPTWTNINKINKLTSVNIESFDKDILNSII